MELTITQLNDLYAGLKAKAYESEEPVTIIIEIQEEFGDYEDDNAIRSIGYEYIAYPNGDLKCNLQMELRDKKTGKIERSDIDNAEYIDQNYLKDLNITGFKMGQVSLKTYKALTSILGITLVTVATKIPSNMKAHLSHIATSQDTTISQIISDLQEPYMIKQITKNVKNLMYQKPNWA